MIFAKKYKVIFMAVLLIIVCYIAPQKFTLKPYDNLLKSDTLLIYNEGKLLANITNPSYILDLYNGSVGIGVTNYSSLGIGKYDMRELYKLDFSESGKIISSIKIMTPKNEKIIEKITSSGSDMYWKKINGNYVVLTENFQYFSFGDDFYEKIAEILYN